MKMKLIETICPICKKPMDGYVSNMELYLSGLLNGGRTVAHSGIMNRAMMVYRCDDCRVEMVAEWKSLNEEFRKAIEVDEE